MKECYFYCSYNDSSYGYELTKAVYDDNGILTQEKPANTPSWIMKKLSDCDSVVELFGIDNSKDGAVLIRNSHLLAPDELRRQDKYISALFIGTQDECRKLTSYIISKPLSFSEKLYSVIRPISSATMFSNSYEIECSELQKLITKFTGDESFKLLEAHHSKKISDFLKSQKDFDKYYLKKAFTVSDHTLEYAQKCKSLMHALTNWAKAKNNWSEYGISIELIDIQKTANRNKQQYSHCKKTKKE